MTHTEEIARHLDRMRLIHRPFPVVRYITRTLPWAGVLIEDAADAAGVYRPPRKRLGTDGYDDEDLRNLAILVEDD